MHVPVTGIKMMLFSARPANMQFLGLFVYNLPHEHRGAMLSAYLTNHTAIPYTFLILSKGFSFPAYTAGIIQTMIDKIKVPAAIIYNSTAFKDMGIYSK